MRNHWKAEYLARLDERTIDALADFGARRPTRLTKILLTRLGGAAARVAEDDTAFSYRAAPFLVQIVGMWDDPLDDERGIEWVRDCWSTLAGLSTWGGVYVNFLDDEGPERVRAAYGDEKLARLTRIKRRYDPDNFFRLNQNIPPAPDH
jgi:hypothetical protein